jgi:hypothetical protein
VHALKIQVLGLIRYLRPDDNPLRRPVDRTYTRLVAGLVALFVVTAAVLTTMTVRLVYDAGVRAEHRQAQTRHRTDAVVVDTAAPAARNGLVKNTRLAWRDSAGRPHTGTVAQSDDDRVGTHRTVWIDRSGALAPHPRTHTQTVTDTALAALSTLTALLIVDFGGYVLVNRRLERRRLALWEGEWATVAPRWTGRP